MGTKVRIRAVERALGLPPDGGLRLLLTPKSALPIKDLDRARWMLRFALQLVMETPPEDAQSGARRGCAAYNASTSIIAQGRARGR